MASSFAAELPSTPSRDPSPFLPASEGSERAERIASLAIAVEPSQFGQYDPGSRGVSDAIDAGTVGKTNGKFI